MKNLSIILGKILDYLNENVWVIIATILVLILAAVIISYREEIGEEKEKEKDKDKEDFEFELGNTKISEMKTKDEI